MIFTPEKIDELIVRCALAGDDRGLARVIAPELLACRSAAAVAAYHAASGLDPGVADHLSAAVVLAWAGDSAGAYDYLHRAHDRALVERRFHLAVAARERLAHHARLFGDVERARTAIDEALALARAHRLSESLTRALAVAAALALDTGDFDRASQLVARGRAESSSRETLALFAPTGAQLAVELRDDAALREWASSEMLDVALRAPESEAAIAATVAVLVGAGAVEANSPASTALRRALLLAESAAAAPELFAMAARCGELEDARRGADAFAAVVAPERPYLKAHRLLAQAHVMMRAGEAAGWIDAAGDAARAFNAMSLRRWTNDAMLLLVAQEPVAPRRRRGRPTGSVLTGREQQVAQLIRRGARNREVALALQISEHTVERHVSSILGRLGLRSRWQIVDPRKPNEH